MRPVLIGNVTDPVVRFSLVETSNGVALMAKAEDASIYVIAEIKPSRMIIKKGISVLSGIPIDEEGHILISKE